MHASILEREEAARKQTQITRDERRSRVRRTSLFPCCSCERKKAIDK